MDPDSVSGEIIVILALILANGLFSMTEMAVVSSRKVRLEALADDGDKGAKAALKLVENPNRMFSSVQIGITLVGLLTGLYGGQTLTIPLTAYIVKIGILQPYAQSISLTIILVSITYLTLIFGELVPKQLAISDPERIAGLVAKPMRLFAFLCLPVVRFLSASTNLVIAGLGIKKDGGPPVTEDEIKLLLEQGAKIGEFENEEPALVDRVFRLVDMDAGDVMTPRTQLEWIDVEDDEATIMRQLENGVHFRMPVGRESLDELVGLVNVNEIFIQLYQSASRQQHLSIRKLILDCVHEPVYIPESMAVMKVLHTFRNEVVHEAVVLDEYGGFSGLLTLHDILEKLVGLMPSGEEEKQEEQNRIIKRNDTMWLVEGLLSIEEFKKYFHIEEELPGEDDDLYKTLAGFITYCFGRIPKETETCAWQNFTFEIMDIDNVRVDKIMVTVHPLTEESDPE